MLKLNREVNELHRKNEEKIIELMKTHAQKKGITEFKTHMIDFNLHSSASSGHKTTIEKEINSQNYQNLLQFFFCEDNELNIQVLPYSLYTSRIDILYKLQNIEITVENQDEVLKNVRLILEKNEYLFEEDPYKSYWFYNKLLSLSSRFEEVKKLCHINLNENDTFEIEQITTKRYKLGLINFLKKNPHHRHPMEVIENIIKLIEELKKQNNLLELLQVEDIYLKAQEHNLEFTLFNAKNELLIDSFIKTLPDMTELGDKLVKGNEKITQEIMKEVEVFIHALILNQSLPQKGIGSISKI